MKRLLLSAVSAIALMATPASADDYKYVGLGFGYGEPEETRVGPPVNGDVESTGGLLGNVTFGRALDSGWRYEIELPYRELDLDAQGGDGEMRSYGALLNLAYDFNAQGAVQPYLGAGVGYGVTDVELRGFANGAGYEANDESDGVLAQGMAGIAFKLTDSLVADVGYRYFFADSSDTYGSLEFNDETRRHDGLVQLRYTFGRSADASTYETAEASTPSYSPPPPPPPPPLPPPPPTPACPRAEATIYFDINSTTVDAESANALSQLAGLRRTDCTTTFIAVGYTDTSGSAAYNQTLARRRASAVQRALVAAGVPASDVRTEALGETNLAVSTAEGIKEERNRRVVVTLQSDPVGGASVPSGTSSPNGAPTGTMTAPNATTPQPGAASPNSETSPSGATTSPYSATPPPTGAATSPYGTLPSTGSTTPPSNTTTSPY